MTSPKSVSPTPKESPLGGASGGTVSSDATVEEPESPEEIASDAALRTWAKDNGIEDVPASGRLSATWRDQITAAMTAVLDPKEEDSAASTSSESSTSVKTETEPAKTSLPIEELKSEPVVEYHSVFQAPNTFVSSQAFTA